MLNGIKNKRYILRLISSLLVGVLFFTLGFFLSNLIPIDLHVVMKTEGQGHVQVFFGYENVGFTESQSKRAKLAGSNDFERYIFSNPIGGLSAIRIDPIESEGNVVISAIEFNSLFWRYNLDSVDDLSSLIPSNDLVLAEGEESRYALLSTGNDPSLIFNSLSEVGSWHRYLGYVLGICFGLAAFFVSMSIFKVGGLKRLSQYDYAIVFVLLLLAFVFRALFWWSSSLPSDSKDLLSVWPDENVYFSSSNLILDKGLAEFFASEESVITAPMNPIYLALVRSLTDSIDFVRFFNVLLSTLSVLIIYLVGKEIHSRFVGLLAGSFLAVNGQIVGYSATMLTEPLFIFLLLMCAFLFVRAVKTDRRDAFLFYSLCFGLFLSAAMLTRSILLLLPIALVLFLVFRSFIFYILEGQAINSRKILGLSTIFIIPLLVVGGVLVKNYVLFDKAIVSTGSGAALWLGSRADTEGDDPPFRGKSYDTSTITGDLKHISLEGDQLLLRAAKENIANNPVEYIFWSVKKVGRLLVGSNLAWFYPKKNFGDWYADEGRKDSLMLLSMLFQILFSSIVVIFGFFYVFKNLLKFDLKMVMVSATMIYMVLLSIPFLSIPRYGLPIVTLAFIPTSILIYEIIYTRKINWLSTVFLVGLVGGIFGFIVI